MKILKNILSIIIIGITIILYISSAIIFSKKYFILLTIIIISLLLWCIYKQIKKINYLKDKESKLLGHISLVFKAISLVIILIFSYSVIAFNGDIPTKILEMDLLHNMGKGDYYSKMNEKKNDNATVICTKDIESTLPLIEEYIEEIKSKCNTLLGINIGDKLTIQIDYDKEVFHERPILFTGEPGYNLGGYYAEKSNTIYLYTNDPVRDVLMNRPHAENIDGRINIDRINFKDILFHEYTHYAIDTFIENNDINNSLVPQWLEEGICQYMSGENLFLEDEFEYIPLKQIQTDEEWNKEVKNIKGDVYEQSKFAVIKIVNEKGPLVLKDMILACKDKNFEAIIKENMNSSFEEFEDTLKIDIKEGNFEAVESYLDSYRNTKIRCLEDYIKYDENNIEAYEFLGTLYNNNKENMKVINLFKYATEKNPEEYILWHRLGVAYEEVGEGALAKESYDKAKLFKAEE